MVKYPTVNYIGNKQKVADWIYESIPIKKGIILDLFSGGNSISYYFKSKNYTVISNDMLYSNFVLSKALIENQNEILKKEEILNINIDESKKTEIYDRISFLANNVYFDYEVEELSELILISKELKGYKKHLFLSLLRRAMIRKIPYSRMNIKWEEIKKFRDEEYSYEKYGRRRAYHNQTFMFHILDNLEEYNNAVFDNKKSNKSYQLDSLDMLKKMDFSVDLIYLDPPYPGTMNNYESFYGYYDLMFEKNISNVLELTNRRTFMDNFKLILEEAVLKTKYIAISLNNRVSISVDELTDYLKRYGKVKVHEMPHVYRVTGKNNKQKNKELLIVLEIKK